MVCRCGRFVSKSIRYLRKLFPRSRRGIVEARVALDETRSSVDADRASQTADSDSEVSTVNSEDTEPQPADTVAQPYLPDSCSRLNSGDVKVHGSHPVRAGAFADVWDGSLDGVPVVIKSYRLYSATDSTIARIRLYKEASACSRLSHDNIVSFRAAYITPKYPLALVYDFMGHRCLGEYVKEDGAVRIVRLLVDVARGLFHMHGQDIIHGNLKTENVLVDRDGAARIAGLGSAFISTQNHGTWSEMDAELLSYGSAPELVHPNTSASRIQTTKKSDIYAFGLLAWELFAGGVPFPDIHYLGAIYLLATGVRPPRPDHPELSDDIWHLIQQCWANDPSNRPPIETVLATFQEQASKAF